MSIELINEFDPEPSHDTLQLPFTPTHTTIPLDQLYYSFFKLYVKRVTNLPSGERKRKHLQLMYATNIQIKKLNARAQIKSNGYIKNSKAYNEDVATLFTYYDLCLQAANEFPSLRKYINQIEEVKIARARSNGGRRLGHIKRTFTKRKTIRRQRKSKHPTRYKKIKRN